MTVSNSVAPTIVTQPQSLTVCVGGAATFTVVANGTQLSYQWRKFDQILGFVDIPGATQSSYTIDPVTQADAGTFDVVVSNVCDSVTSFAVNLLVDDGNVVILSQPSDQTGCEGTPVTFSVSVQGTPPFTYQWRKDGFDIAGATQPVYTIVAVAPSDAGLYDVIVSSTCGTVTSDSALLTVIPFDPPVIIVQPASQTVCEGGTAVLAVGATGAQPFSYQWRKDRIDIPGATADTLTIDPVGLFDVGVYEVIVSNACDTTTIDAAVLDVARRPIITRQPRDRVATDGETATLVVSAIAGPLSYQWQKDGLSILGATSPDFTVVAVSLADEGDYRCRIDNACDSILSSASRLTVASPPRTVRVSVSTAGVEPEEDVSAAAVSDDGRFVAFYSRSARLARGTFDSFAHVFLHDNQSATTTRLDRAPDGPQTNADSSRSVMSPDERWIAFESVATNVVAGDTNGARDVFLIETTIGTTVRISAPPGGGQANADSGAPAIARFADIVAFESDADNLVPNDTNSARDIFVYDRQNASLTRVNVDSMGRQANGAGRHPSVSEDGRLVVFESDADNLVANDTNGVADIFLHDRQTGETIRVSIDANGIEANGASAAPVLSLDGLFVAFESSADNLVADDTNGVRDAFALELTTGAVFLVSRDVNGVLGNADSYAPSITGDGQSVAFLSLADNLVPNDTNGLVDVFLHDLSGLTIRASVANSGQEANAASAAPTVSSDGLFVVFESTASNLVDNDSNGRSDIFRHNVATTSTDRISIDDQLGQANGTSRHPSISGGTQYILFSSAADNLSVDDFNESFDIFSRNIQLNRTEVWTRAWAADDDSFDPAVSSDGRFVAFESRANNLVPNDSAFPDVFVYDNQTTALELVSVNSSGIPANESSFDPAISADGGLVAFVSAATNLAPQTTGGVLNVFLRDRAMGVTTLASVNAAGEPANAPCGRPVLSADGRFIAYASSATNLVAGDNNKSDVFVFDTQSRTTTRVSIATGGIEANGDSAAPAISDDGNTVAFMSLARNLVAGDNNDQSDVFVHDRTTGQTQLVSINQSGGVGDDASGFPAISADGRRIAFDSGAKDLVPNDDNLRVDVFVRDMLTGLTTIVSVDDNGLQGADGDSARPAVSADGRFIAFESEATTLVFGDANGKRDIFVHDGSGCLAPSIVTHPQSQTVFTGQQFTLTVIAGGTPSLSFQWRKNGTDILGANGHTLTILFPTLADAGDYDVVVSNNCGTVISDVATIVVQECIPIVAIASVSAPGVEAGRESAGPSLSTDGRHVAFHSDADLLVPGDAFGFADVFVYDRHTERIAWISVSPDGRFGNAGSYFPSISGDGRFVAFQSGADNLVADDTNGFVDVFVRDRDPDGNGTYDEGNAVTFRVSVTSSGAQANNSSDSPSMSADGRIVTFASQASNLVAGGSSGEHVYAHDLSTGLTTRVSVDSNGNAGDNDSRDPSVSADGRFVAFWSRANNLDPNDVNLFPDIFVRDRQAGTTVLVSVDSNGKSLPGDTRTPAISSNGLFVTFISEQILVPEDQNGVADVYVRDRPSARTTRVSVDDNGIEANLESFEPAISSDGRFVVYYSDATNLVPSDLNGVRDAFRRDRSRDQTTLISTSTSGEQGDQPTGQRLNAITNSGIAISADGFYAAFFSLANNLVPHDNNPKEEVFLRELGDGLMSRVSVSAPGVPGSGLADLASVSAFGRFIAYESTAENLVLGDTNQSPDIFLYDRLTEQTRRYNVSPTGEQAPPFRSSRDASISGDGRYLAYSSDAEDLVPNDLNGRRDIFVADVESRQNVLVSISSSGAQGNHESGLTNKAVAISFDGRFVAFESMASNLVPNDNNGQPDIFVHDRDPDANGVFDEGNGVTTRVSVGDLGQT